MKNPVDSMLAASRRFAAAGLSKKYTVPKQPAKKTAIVTCMDTRLIELLPASLGIRGGDVKMIKNAGGLVTDPWDTSMRSILVAIYELGVENVMIIAHTECGVQGMDGDHFVGLIRKRGVPAKNIETIHHCGIDIESWLTGFDDPELAVQASVEIVKQHPLMPRGVSVRGFIFDTATGLLTEV